MVLRGSLLDLVEGAYEHESSADEWLRRAADGFAARVDGGITPFAYTLAKRSDGPPILPVKYTPIASDPEAFFEQANAPMSAEMADLFYPKGTKTNFFRATLAAIPGEPDFRLVEESMKELGADDIFAASSVDAAGFGIMVGVFIRGMRITETAREGYCRLAVHLAAGLRLRRVLLGEDVFERAEAVFETDGRLAHARGQATAEATRSRLQDAVGSVDKARTARVRQDDVTALELWQGLVQGRWSLIDRYDTDGRRYYVAIANPHIGVEDRALTEVEAQVAAQVVAGEPNKVIAYSLGLAESTVARHVVTTMKKLGVKSRVELVRLGHSLGA